MTQCQSETNEGREMRDDSMSAEGMQETHSSCISSGQMKFPIGDRSSDELTN